MVRSPFINIFESRTGWLELDYSNGPTTSLRAHLSYELFDSYDGG